MKSILLGILLSAGIPLATTSAILETNDITATQAKEVIYTAVSAYNQTLTKFSQSVSDKTKVLTLSVSASSSMSSVSSSENIKRKVSIAQKRTSGIRSRYALANTNINIAQKADSGEVKIDVSDIGFDDMAKDLRNIYDEYNLPLNLSNISEAMKANPNNPLSTLLVAR